MSYLFQDVGLPEEFRFPIAYVRLVESGQFPQVDPWWFLAEEPEKSRLLFRIINIDQKSKKLLVPFAKIDDESGDVACFDGDDFSGNPRIFFSTGEESSHENTDWENRYSVASFDSWLRIIGAVRQ